MVKNVIPMINKDNFVDLLLAWYEREKQKEKENKGVVQNAPDDVNAKRYSGSSPI